MTSDPRPQSSAENQWRTLAMLFAALLALSAILIGIWLAGGRQSLNDSFAARLILAALLPLNMTWIALSSLRKKSEGPPILPTPVLVYLTLVSQIGSQAPWYFVCSATSPGLSC